MQFRVQVLLLAALVTFTLAAPAPEAEVQARQAGCQTIFWPAECPAGQTACNASGSIILCCNSC
ncbi:nuclear pore complex subunit [Moniliophthora roreri]|nr:nuclear pore complex subunit [Moniliophthora roreri]